MTGGATGIGFGICETFGKHGCRIAILSRKKPVIDNAVAKLQAQGIDAFGVQVVFWRLLYPFAIVYDLAHSILIGRCARL